MGNSIIKYPSDYADKLLEKYPYLTRATIIRILNYGFRVMIDFVLSGYGFKFGRGDKYIVKHRYKDQQKYLFRQISNAERCRFVRYSKEWDGYYYFAYSKTKFAELDQNKLTKNNVLEFNNINMFKAPDECYHKYRTCLHFFRVEYPFDCGWYMYKEKFRTNKYEYLGAWRNEGTALTRWRKDEIQTLPPSQLPTTS